MTQSLFNLKLSDPATEDFISLLAYSERMLGNHAKKRYEQLIFKALENLIENPLRIGSKVINVAANDEHRSYHLSSAKRGSGVHQPRHMIVYCINAKELLVKRVLHDSMDLSAQINQSDL